jgi:hypothetical protein
VLVQSPASDSKHTCKQANVCNKDSEHQCSDTKVNHLVGSKNNQAFFQEEPARQILMMEKKIKSMLSSRIKKKYLTL